jgi:hypothetical protein
MMFIVETKAAPLTMHDIQDAGRVFSLSLWRPFRPESGLPPPCDQATPSRHSIAGLDYELRFSRTTTAALESAEPFYHNPPALATPSRPLPPGMGLGMLLFRHIHSCSSFEPRAFPSTLSVYY